MCLMFGSGIGADVVVFVVVVFWNPVFELVFVFPLVVLVFVLVVLVVVFKLDGSVWMLCRGVKMMFDWIPCVPNAAARLRIWVLFTSSTITSTITSDLGLSRSDRIISAKAIWSASARTIIAFCDVY